MVTWVFAGLIMNNFNSNLSLLLTLTQKNNNQTQVQCRSKYRKKFGGVQYFYRWVFGYLYFFIFLFFFKAVSINYRNKGWGLHLRCTFRLPDLAPSRGKLSPYSLSKMTLVRVKMHLPILSWENSNPIGISGSSSFHQEFMNSIMLG